MPWWEYQEKSRPSREEKVAIDAFMWGFITREKLDQKIGRSRADFLLSKRPAKVVDQPKK